MQTFESPIERFNHWRTESPNSVFLRQPSGHLWKEYNWTEAWQQAGSIATFLKQFPERSHIALYSLNCAEWFIVDLAILMAGHISVPIYPTAGKRTIEYILKHAEVKLSFVGKLFDWEVKQDCFEADKCISFFKTKAGVQSIESLIQSHRPIESWFNAKPSDTATIIYTSGTTGDPKGVVLSYRAIFNSLATVDGMFSITSNDRFFSYLPLAHVAERMAVEMASIYFGSSVSFVESLDHFAKNLRSVQPTIFFAVPRIWLKLKHGVAKKLGGDKTLSILLHLPIFGKHFKRLLKKMLGFSKLRLALSGGASLPLETIHWFESLDVEICEVYGLTETAGFSHINLPDFRKAGSVGRPFPGAECIIADNGEILLKNASLMEGYYKESELSKLAIQDGWFRTGDLGRVDSDGFMFLTGRIKEIFKTSKGKYIAPDPIENKLVSRLDFEYLCVMGADLPNPVVVAVTLQDRNKEETARIERHVTEVLNDLNEELEAHEKIKTIFIVSDEWTPDNGLMTPTLKLRRQPIEERYRALISSHKKSNKKIIWSDQ